MNLGTTYSVAFWFKDWDTSDDGVIFGGAAGHYVCYADSAQFYHSAGPSNYTSELHPLTGTVSTWHHLCVTRNGTTVFFYLDGVKLGSHTDLIPSNNALIVTTLGSYEDGSVPIAITLDDLRIYSTTLSDADVAELYALVPTTPPASGDAVDADLTVGLDPSLHVSLAPQLGGFA